MSVEVAKSRFMRSSLSCYTGAFYQRLFAGVAGFKELGDKLVREAQIAHGFRRVSVVKEVATILCSLPLREHQTIGHYYLAWCARRGSEKDLDKSQIALERVLESATTEYKARALLSLGAVSALRGDHEAHLHYYFESMRAARNRDASTIVEAQQGIAILKAKAGHHKSALKDLEGLLPLARHSDPLVYCDFLNSYAVELSLAGQLSDARTVSKRVLASPFAGAYPEWSETYAEIELRGYRASRSRIAVGPPCSDADNVVRLPASEYGAATEPSLGSQPARVLSFLEGKKKMDKESNGPPRDYSKMSGRELLLKILELAGSSDRTDDELSRMLGAIERVLSKSQKPKK